MLLVDSDNALGSTLGDVDDVFALAALLRSPIRVDAISSVAGNTSERRAFANNGALAAIAGYGGSILRASEAPDFLAARPGEIVLALGPLTNVAAALRRGAKPAAVVIIGGNLSSTGRWPPWWPHEFNLTKDREATLEVFHSGVPLTIFPLDVARVLSVTRADLAALKGPLGRYLWRGSRRWMTRLRVLRWTGEFPIYDLAAALYVIDPFHFKMERRTALMRENTSLVLGEGTREVTVCRELARDALWKLFRAMLR